MTYRHGELWTDCIANANVRIDRVPRVRSASGPLSSHRKDGRAVIKASRGRQASRQLFTRLSVPAMAALLVTSCHTAPRSHSVPSVGPSAGAQLAGSIGYLNCDSNCGDGQVPAALRRPLRPAAASTDTACPRSRAVAAGTLRIPGVAPSFIVLGSDPIYVGFDPAVGRSGVAHWGAAQTAVNGRSVIKTLINIAPQYSGPVLLRGRQIPVGGAIGWGDGSPFAPSGDLQLPPLSGSRAWRTTGFLLGFPGSGCYAVQADTTVGSTVVVFSAAP